jgi:tellurite methyltransferase
MQAFLLEQLVGSTDIYLLDQILKGRYRRNEVLLDAGCGNGRNLQWFLLHDIQCFGVDSNPEALAELKKCYPSLPAANIIKADLQQLPFPDQRFDHVISSAVLHFANNYTHFELMFAELVRVLRTGGSLFIRMTSDIGIENKVHLVGDGVYNIPDGSTRFLLTKQILANLTRQHPVKMMEPLKTVNVNDERCMSTLVFQRI